MAACSASTFDRGEDARRSACACDLGRSLPSCTRKLPMAWPQLPVVGIFHPILSSSPWTATALLVDETVLKSVRIKIRRRHDGQLWATATKVNEANIKTQGGEM